MPLPEGQVASLEACLAEHEAHLERIRDGGGSEEEALVQETLLGLGRSCHVMWALDDLWEHPASAQRDSAVDYFRRYGVPIPAHADVRFVGHDEELRVEATFAHGAQRYTVIWDRRLGFSVLHLQGRRIA